MREAINLCVSSALCDFSARRNDADMTRRTKTHSSSSEIESDELRKEEKQLVSSGSMSERLGKVVSGADFMGLG